jgi:uncharacterized membrane protein YfcA
VTQLLIGFVIALAVGLTGIGGGSFTVPALVLIVGLPAGTAVGTAFVYAGVMRLIAAPFYLLGKHIHARYLWLLLQGAIPGLLIGTYLLRLLSASASSATVVVIVLGALLTASSVHQLCAALCRILSSRARILTGCAGFPSPSASRRDFPPPEPASSGRCSC